jgi:hypothetical protein
MKAIKQRQKTQTTIEWFGICPECGKEIAGSTESQVQYNMRLHLETHTKHQTEVK